MHIAPHRRQRHTQKIHTKHWKPPAPSGWHSHTDVWVPHKVSKAFLTVFLHMILYSTHNDNAPFLRGDGRSCATSRSRSDCGAGELNHHWTHQGRSPSKKAVLCMWWDWKGVLCYEGLPENQAINSNKHQSQLDQLKAALDKKPPEMANRRCIISSQGNQGRRLLWRPDKTCYSSPGKFWLTLRTHQPSHLRMSIYSIFTKFS